MNDKKINIFLIGFMGSGKSSVSRVLHRKYQMEQLEMDEEIERQEQMTISEIFQEKGEPYFRNLETELLKKIGSRENLVVSCGGGTAMRKENVQIMRNHGRIVLLKASPETVYERVRNSHARPLLEGNMNVSYIRKLMEGRMPAYEEASDFIVETDGKKVEEICREILRQL